MPGNYCLVRGTLSPLPLQKDCIYGPIRSKRFGLSLGINLLPTTHKVCSFDCIYCHYGRTNIKTISSQGISFPTKDSVINRLEEYLKSDIKFDYITFSGNGEPLLFPDFSSIVSEAKRLRDRYRPKSPIALLTNSSLINKKGLIETLKLIDLPVFKLDAGDEKTFQEINRPVPGIKLEGIIEGLKEIGKEIKLAIQTVFLNGKVKNFTGLVFADWLSAIIEIKPSFIQVYSVDRPVAEEDVRMLENNQLLEKAEEIEKKTKIKATAYLP